MEQTIQASAVFSYLNFVPFSELKVWDVKRQNNENLSFSYPVSKLGNFLKKAKISWVEVEDDLEYPILGVRANGKGVYLNRVAKGSELTMRRYQKSKSYHLFYCKVRTVNGQWGIVYPEFENTYGSSNMQYLEIDRKKIIPEYLELILRVKDLTNQWDKNAIGADGRHFTLDTLLNLEMPLPELSEQEKILSDYNFKIKQSEKLEAELNSFSENYENILFEFLGITKIPVKQATNSLQFIKLVNTSRWGYQYLLNHEQSERLLDTAKFPQKLLSSLVLLNPTTSFNELKKDNKISFLPMECVSDLYGEVIEYRDGKVQSSGGYTKFQEGDLLWSKITPWTTEWC